MLKQLISLLFLQSFSSFSSSSSSSSSLLNDLRAEEVAIIQFDSRPLRNYWFTASLWNYHYTQQHNHSFLYYTLQDDCHYKETKLAEAWCKVRAMIQVQFFSLLSFLFSSASLISRF